MVKMRIDPRTVRALYRGELGPSAEAVGRWVEVTVTASMLISNVLGAGAVFVVASWVMPLPVLPHPVEIRLENLAALGAYGAVSLPAGVIWGNRRFSLSESWIRQDLPPTDEQVDEVLRAPYRLVAVPAVLWVIAAALFGVLNAHFSVQLGRIVASTVALGGVATCTVAFLLAERFLRPAAALALAGGRRRAPRLLGVEARTVLGWTFGTALPILSLLLVAVAALTGIPVSTYQLAITILGLGGLALLIGFVVTSLVARSIADPIRSLRRAFARVEQGDFDCEVSVYDGTEIGDLQSGFNHMLAGLRERERLRDVFGRQVGEAVARAALDGEIELGGEVRDVAVMFADIVASTALAATRSPQEVVEVINRFLAVVIRQVDRHEGWVNKFEGDAALAVFGAPLAMEDHCSKALATARAISKELESELPDYSAAIGVASGPVVAGNVGDLKRYEYTVIGDPVNEAARLTELAKTAPGGVLASGDTLRRANPQEASHWETVGEVLLRGRTEPTVVANLRT
jgi:adenylate cyclase